MTCTYLQLVARCRSNHKSLFIGLAERLLHMQASIFSFHERKQMVSRCKGLRQATIKRREHTVG